MWKNSVNVDIKFIDKNLIDFAVRSGVYNYFVSCIYGAPEREGRPKI